MTLAVLAGSNVLVNRVFPDRVYVPWNVAMTVTLAGLAGRCGLGRSELALEPAHVGAGVRSGLAAGGVIAVAYGRAATRRGSAALRDDRVSGLDRRQARYHALVRIPLGTVLLEEFAFRGLLPALLRKPGRRDWVPDSVASVLFGLWHVLPSRELAAANDWAGGVIRRGHPAAMSAAAVAATAAAGGLLQALRRHGGHLVAPMLAHWASNALGLAAARYVVRR